MDPELKERVQILAERFSRSVNNTAELLLGEIVAKYEEQRDTPVLQAPLAGVAASKAPKVKRKVSSDN